MITNGKRRDLGSLTRADSFATSINNKGQVVGYSRSDRPESDRPFLYSDGKMRNLNDLIPTNSNYELVGALAINDAGQILVNSLSRTATFSLDNGCTN
jgi:probable HAF family extracellular repeat protein